MDFKISSQVAVKASEWITQTIAYHCFTLPSTNLVCLYASRKRLLARLRRVALFSTFLPITKPT